jgi:hypothetical protein
VTDRGARRQHAAHRIEADLPTEHVGGERAGRRHEDRHERHRPQQLEQRQREHVEADVVTEDRIDAAEAGGVEIRQPRIPLPAGIQTDEQPEHARRDHHQRPEARRIHRDRPRPFRGDDGELPRPQRAEGDGEIAREHREHHQAGGHGHRGPGGQRADEHLLVTQFPEPQPVGVELGEGRKAEQDQDGDEEEREAPEHAAARL